MRHHKHMTGERLHRLQRRRFDPVCGCCTDNILKHHRGAPATMQHAKIHEVVPQLRILDSGKRLHVRKPMPPLKRGLPLAVVDGLRRSELMRLTPELVDIKAGVTLVPTTEADHRGRLRESCPTQLRHY